LALFLGAILHKKKHRLHVFLLKKDTAVAVPAVKKKKSFSKLEESNKKRFGYRGLQIFAFANLS